MLKMLMSFFSHFCFVFFFFKEWRITQCVVDQKIHKGAQEDVEAPVDFS